MPDTFPKQDDANQHDGSAPKPQRTLVLRDLAWWHSKTGCVILLILFGDLLFWGYRPGFTLALFAILVFAIAVLRVSDRTGVIRPAIVLALAVLPIFEHVQVLSVSILAVGLLIALAWLQTLREGGLAWLFMAVWRLVKSIPLGGATACIVKCRSICDRSQSGSVFTDVQAGTLWRNWAFPVGGTLVLGALLISANPVFENIVVRVFQLDLNVLEWVPRGMFWIGLGLLVWPLISLPVPVAPKVLNTPTWNGGFGLNAGSVLRALIVFNVFIAIQSGLDIFVLIGGAKLPEGMSYATYAQRGAYPLMATAMLAGAFSIAARPFLNAHWLVKPMLYIWIAQNVVLTLSATLRLDLYIAEYGLTYLRVYALIWMGLVAVGLCLLMWQILRERSSKWLLVRTAVLGAGTLYVCAFVNFAALLATDTISRAADATHSRAVDWSYLCSLGPTAAKTVAQGLEQNPEIDAPDVLISCLRTHPQSTNWREWDFREARTRVSG